MIPNLMRRITKILAFTLVVILTYMIFEGLRSRNQLDIILSDPFLKRNFPYVIGSFIGFIGFSIRTIFTKDSQFKFVLLTIYLICIILGSLLVLNLFTGSYQLHEGVYIAYSVLFLLLLIGYAIKRRISEEVWED